MITNSSVSPQKNKKKTPFCTEDGLGAYEELAKNLPKVLRDGAVVVMGYLVTTYYWVVENISTGGLELNYVKCESNFNFLFWTGIMIQ